jgi:hypothetical protein
VSTLAHPLTEFLTFSFHTTLLTANESCMASFSLYSLHLQISVPLTMGLYPIISRSCSSLCVPVYLSVPCRVNSVTDPCPFSSRTPYILSTYSSNQASFPSVLIRQVEGISSNEWLENCSMNFTRFHCLSIHSQAQVIDLLFTTVNR